MKNKLLAVIVLAVLAGWALPRVRWGRLEMRPSETVTVTGESKMQVKNQIASFSAGVDVINDNKDTAAKEIKSKMDTLTAEVKKFGISEGDIKTQSLSYYQQEESYYDNGVQKSRKGQWRVSTTIEITLRDVGKADGLASLLAGSGANNVWGPNFMVDDTSEAETQLFEGAMKNAKEKAEAAAKAAGRELGRVISVSEGGSSGGLYPMFRGAEGGGGAPMLEPGSGTVSKTVTVSYELK